MDARKIRAFAKKEFGYYAKITKSSTGYGIFTYNDFLDSTQIKRLNNNFKRWSIVNDARGLLIMVYE